MNLMKNFKGFFFEAVEKGVRKPPLYLPLKGGELKWRCLLLGGGELGSPLCLPLKGGKLKWGWGKQKMEMFKSFTLFLKGLSLIHI